jgi:hypothetical protein
MGQAHRLLFRGYWPGGVGSDQNERIQGHTVMTITANINRLPIIQVAGRILCLDLRLYSYGLGH